MATAILQGFSPVDHILKSCTLGKYAFFRPLKIRIEASPMRDGDIDFSTHSIITAGSQGYNIVTNYCISQNLTQLCITQNGTVIEIAKGKDKGEIIR